jgi:hypothetical protein
MNSKMMNFFGSLLVLSIAISIFFMLMTREMPPSNRELLISFVSVLFGAMAGSIKKVTGDESESDAVKELKSKIRELQAKLKEKVD